MINFLLVGESGRKTTMVYSLELVFLVNGTQKMAIRWHGVPQNPAHVGTDLVGSRYTGLPCSSKIQDAAVPVSDLVLVIAGHLARERLHAVTRPGQPV